MKFFNRRINLILISLSMLIVSTTSIETFAQNFLGHSHKFTNETAATNATGATSNSTGSAASNATAGNAASSSASNGASKIISAAPYKISECDQVLYVETQKLADFNDFTKKAPAFFTISVYMVNLFDKKDGNTLLQSISLDKMIKMPEIMPGSISCIRFGDLSGKQFAMCLPDKATANQIVTAFGQFMKCRMGDNLKDTPATTIKNVLKASCLGLDVNFDIKKFGGDINLAKASLQTAMTNALKNAAANLKSSISNEKPKDPLKVIDGKAK